MTKYTISKAFSQRFPFNIWKIVADSDSKLLAVELRNPADTLPILYSLDFEGVAHLSHLQLQPKEWTLDAVNKQLLVVKKVGENSPVGAGVLLIDHTGKTLYESHEHILLQSEANHIVLRQRSLQAGFERYVDFENFQNAATPPPVNPATAAAITLPAVFNGEIPSFLKDVTIIDQLWLSRWQEKWIWSYHTKENNSYNLNLCIADRSNILYKQCLLQAMPKMIPQPYFQIANQIFLLSYNKQEIVSYLL